MSGLSAETRPSPADRVLSFVERIFPAPSAWAFALRIWLAMVLALYAGFWLQLSGASSAAVCVAILAQPKRGQALSKALYRFLGTLAGGAISILLIGAFGQDRVLLLVSVATWLGLCVFVAHFLQDTAGLWRHARGLHRRHRRRRPYRHAAGGLRGRHRPCRGDHHRHRRHHLHQRRAGLAQHVAAPCASRSRRPCRPPGLSPARLCPGRIPARSGRRP